MPRKERPRPAGSSTAKQAVCTWLNDTQEAFLTEWYEARQSAKDSAAAAELVGGNPSADAASPGVQVPIHTAIASPRAPLSCETAPFPTNRSTGVPYPFFMGQRFFRSKGGLDRAATEDANEEAAEVPPARVVRLSSTELQLGGGAEVLRGMAEDEEEEEKKQEEVATPSAPRPLEELEAVETGGDRCEDNDNGAVICREIPVGDDYFYSLCQAWRDAGSCGEDGPRSALVTSSSTSDADEEDEMSSTESQVLAVVSGSNSGKLPAPISLHRMIRILSTYWEDEGLYNAPGLV